MPTTVCRSLAQEELPNSPTSPVIYSTPSSLLTQYLKSLQASPSTPSATHPLAAFCTCLVSMQERHTKGRDLHLD